MGQCYTGPRSKPPHQRNRESEVNPSKTPSRLEASVMFCPNSHALTTMCVDRDCESSALLCSEPACAYGPPSHPNCATTPLADVVALIKERSRAHDKMMKKMHDTEAILVNEIIAKRRSHFDEILSQLKEGRFSNIINRVYFNRQEHLDFRGSEAWEFVEKLKNSNAKIEDIQNSCLEDYEREIRELAKELAEVQRAVMMDYAEHCRIHIGKKTESSVSSRPSVPRQPNCELDSVILKEHSDIVFIEETLGHPKKIELLFRASEHGFKAEAFHLHCDDTPDTLTVIQTEFGRKVVGYTPLVWNAAHGFAADSSHRSFLLSV
jgi:hypothetical protein